MSKRTAKRRPGNPATRAASYWHGGIPGLKPGDSLLPPSTTAHPVPTNALMPYEHDPDAVYLTNSFAMARAYATHYKANGVPGDVYRARPVGEVRIDPDYDLDPPVSFMCSEAVVERVVERSVALSDEEMVRAHAPFSRWNDGTPMYDADGRFSPGPWWDSEIGIDRAILREFAPWTDLMTALEVLSERVARGEIEAPAWLPSPPPGPPTGA